MITKEFIKSKSRIRYYGEVFTPDFIVNNMLDLVQDEIERIESRFLEPACGDGNFLIKILERKLNVVEKKYRKNQYEYEKHSLVAVSSIYGIDLLEDNVKMARERLYDFFEERYFRLYKRKVNVLFLENIRFILEKNIVQGDALTFKNKIGRAIIFSEWSSVNGKIKRKDFQFKDLPYNEKDPTLFCENGGIIEQSDDGRVSYSPIPVKEYPAVNFLQLKEQENFDR